MVKLFQVKILSIHIHAPTDFIKAAEWTPWRERNSPKAWRDSNHSATCHYTLYGLLCNYFLEAWKERQLSYQELLQITEMLFVQ